MASLPVNLEIEPIMEALCEIQFVCSSPASQVLPGYMYSKLDGEKQVKKLAAASIPPEILAADQSLQFQPSAAISWRGFQLRFSDRSMQVVCGLPYPKWNNFFAAINEVFSLAIGSGIVKEVTRYSLKYVNFIEAGSINAQKAVTALTLTVGRNAGSFSAFQVQGDVPSEFATTVLTIASPASRKDQFTEVEGVLISSDSIVMGKHLPPDNEIRNNFAEHIDRLHTECKAVFFNTLTEETVNSLRPTYE